jgi:hypothetical protein
MELFHGRVSEWLLFNANSANFQLYHVENKRSNKYQFIVSMEDSPQKTNHVIPSSIGSLVRWNNVIMNYLTVKKNYIRKGINFPTIFLNFIPFSIIYRRNKFFQSENRRSDYLSLVCAFKQLFPSLISHSNNCERYLIMPHGKAYYH